METAAPHLSVLPRETIDALGVRDGALIVDGALLSPSDCPLACPDGLSNRQAACIANADCANWTACAP